MGAVCECGCGGRVSFRGTYRAGHEPAGTSRDPHGKIKAADAISNAKWNPIRSAKVQKRAEDEAVKRINEFSPNEKALTLAEAKQCVAVIMERVSRATQGVALEEFLLVDASDHYSDDWGPSFYWGYTSRSLADEDLR
jgi:hypothetical protein